MKVDKKINDKLLDMAGKSYLVQDNQVGKASNRLEDLEFELNSLSQVNDNNLNSLDELLKEAKGLIHVNNIELEANKEQNYIAGEKFIKENSIQNANDIKSIKIPVYENLETIEVDDEISFDSYLDNISIYANKNQIDLGIDPFDALLSMKDKEVIANRIKNDYYMKKSNCDKYDYMIASFCGIIAGLIDSIFVGMPGKSKLGNWTDSQTDKWIIKVAKMSGHKGVNGDINISNSIRFFEDRYKVNYDQATGKSAGKLLDMSMSNHHIKSLGHAPDLIGLIFSVVDQFSSTSHFLDNGRLITFDTEKFTLRGNNFVAKLFCGISNWLGHLISDMAGSAGTRTKVDSRGSGIPMPLFELFQLIGKGSFKVYESNDKTKQFTERSFADLSVRVFQDGYDARFGMAQAIPVMINEMSIRLLWSLKCRYYTQNSWKECIPFGNNPELRRMLLTGHGVLCIVDSLDAVVRSEGQVLLFTLHLNFVAWKRLAFAGLMEVRSIYKENTIDLGTLEKDLEIEWNELYLNSSI